ncbi:MAG TPA: hypothetical protein VK137_09670 [Planctomycetaceae bacterium]|nr:hypothetical protein [Planctomycetaceae bacterium]
MSRKKMIPPSVHELCLALPIALAGCGGNSPAPIDAPIRYHSNAELKARLEEVSKYGDGGSSLGGISESIAELTKTDPAKGQKLLADFDRLNTADSKEVRKKIAQEMAEQLK